jgi:uncharacterized protein (DUF433 family)
MKDWTERISIDPEVCHGRPCIRGTRIFVSIILDNLAAGHTEEEIFHHYPALTHEDIIAALKYASAMVTHREIDLPLDKSA